MRRIHRFAAPCGLGLAVLLNLPAGLAAAPGSQAAPAPPAAAAALSAEPLPGAAETFAAGASQIVRRVAGREAETPSLDGFLASLRGGQPQPASSCSATTTCLCGGTVSCSGSTCSQGVGCFVVCDGIEHDCRGCSHHPCA